MGELWSTSWDDGRILRVVTENISDSEYAPSGGNWVTLPACCRLLRIMRGEYEEKLLEMRGRLLQAELRAESAVRYGGVE